VIRVPDPTTALIAPAPNPAKTINAMWEADTVVSLPGSATTLADL
jgi:hypothetical protein